ncbi:MAG: bphD [Mycobacterium sp.]|jgi:pimeloyl-ACP methyl ester carboxylesterase|nr:bphD [Mycobacterium sp.]
MHLAGGSIAYTIAGAGPALLLIHGLGGTRKTGRYMIDDLARTHTVIAPELPGHGESDPPAGDYPLGAHACALEICFCRLDTDGPRSPGTVSAAVSHCRPLTSFPSVPTDCCSSAAAG